jgi:hypothetical protein
VNVHDAFLIKALHGVLNQDHEAFVRRVKRFYSKNFHVPLPHVDDLEEEHVFQTYYEELVDQMSEEDRDELLAFVTETDEEREARERKEQAYEGKDVEFETKVAGLTKEVLSGAVRKPKTKLKMPQKKAPAKPPEQKPPEPAPMPDIHVNFESNLPPEWADMDPLGPPHKK